MFGYVLCGLAGFLVGCGMTVVVISLCIAARDN